MKFSAQWLREWVEHPLTAEQLAEQLTMAGLEVESVEAVAGDFTGILVGKVLATQAHSDAEKLTLCQVDTGQGAPLSIVCGAANARADIKVAVAIDGAVVQGREIKTAKLRGVTSQGMLCSAKELGLQESSEGILELSSDAPLGADLRSWLQLNDQVLDLRVTPNRGDCLGMLGIAREVAALNNVALQVPEIVASPVAIDEQMQIEIKTPQACPRYLGRVIKGIDAKAVTPIWLQERLRRSGLRAMHPVVDITNYVLLELGQPLHAFDRTKLAAPITVRYAKAGEALKLLNEQIITLDEKTLVIADANGPQALAGIMGGLDTSVTDTCTEIFLECAFFDPINLAGCARHYGLNTDAAHRYERGVDPELPLRAIERATQLILAIAGGQAGPILSCEDKKYLPVPASIPLKRANIEKLLGIKIDDAEIEDSLQRLGMQLQAQTEGWLVTAPSYRFDIALEADLIEEIIRIKGYDNLPPQRPQMQLAFLAQSENRVALSRMRNLLVDKGYHEAITYSFVAPKLQKLLEPHQTPVTLLNPISADLAVMRTTLWAGLLTAALYNYNRQQSRVRLFESGLRFCGEGTALQQEQMLAGLAMGNLYAEEWGVTPRSVDFYDVKADLQALFTLTGCADEFIFRAGKHSALHPGQCSEIVRNGEVMGYLGALHPAILQEVDIKGPLFVFELQLAAISQAQKAQFKSLSKFPAIRRDIAFWIDANIPVQAVLDCISTYAGKLLNKIWLFDVYQNPQKDPEKRSLAIGLLLQHPERTLVDAEVNQLMDAIITSLQQQYTISLRE